MRLSWLPPLERIVRVQSARPLRVLLVAALTVILALASASRLELRTALGELLPRDRRSVQVAEEVRARLPAVSTLTILVEGRDLDGLRRFVDALAARLAAADGALVGRVDAGVQEARRFVADHALLYAERERLEAAAAAIDARYDYEIARRAGAWLDDSVAPPAVDEAKLREILGASEAARFDRYPGGYYLDQEAGRIVLNVQTPVRPGDLAGTAALRGLVDEAIAAVDLAAFDREAKVRFGGNLLTAAETYRQIRDDLTHVGAWGAGLILGVVFLYFLRLRALLAMLLTIGVGVSWTFGVAALTVGYLSSSTGFLFSIVVGNGINFGIVYMARYLEARREGGVEESLLVAHHQTWRATLTAAAAASAAYGSLMITEFRGFQHFGIIGASGMLLCWLATYAFLPSILSLSERLRPLEKTSPALRRYARLYGRPFALLATRFPRAVVAAGASLTLLTGVLAVRYLLQDPMEYDMRAIDSDRKRSEAREVGKIADRLVGRRGQDALAIATQRVDQVAPLVAILEARRAAAPAGAAPFERVVTLDSLLPRDQPAKVALVARMANRIRRARAQGHLDEATFQRLEPQLAAATRALTTADLPEAMTRPFTEEDGTVGRLVYVVPTVGRSLWDGHYLITWAESFRRTELPDGSVIHGSGRSVIFADIILAIRADAPRAILASLVLTLLIVGFAFRERRLGVLVVLSVLLGLVWTLGVTAIYDSQWSLGLAGLAPLRLNFLNFVALPITIGVGADYAVNVMQRRREGATAEAVRETGGAVVLCSLTTMLGYLALHLSDNRAIRSFGAIAAVGEVACLLTGVLLLPAALILAERRTVARRANEDAR
ncbi:MAG: MMPL family transporter [Myxococcales bacterium]|nr:MMPL family transporter [Myxococcales bacterium]